LEYAVDRFARAIKKPYYSFMKILFTKMTGAGNDFVVIDNRKNLITDKVTLARKLCDRHWGIGADGLLLLERDKKAAYRMEYHNADGSYGGMCGNGGRCIAAYAVEHGIAAREHSFLALDHVYEAIVNDPIVKLKMKDPTSIQLNLMLPVQDGSIRIHFVDTGAPHAVVVMRGGGSGLESVDVMRLGRELRHHSHFQPSGSNVDFLEIEGTKNLTLRTYERGVETETLACGTGSIAAGVVAFLVDGIRPPTDVRMRSGAVLRVDFGIDSDGKPRDVWLTGPVAVVFEGSVDV
jgi:diaminopimelate epimerase